jgi:branched-chain amino acid transport system ATP-binding protein
MALELFPELASRKTVAAGLLSGGEQQMLTVARALSRRPAVLLADELSWGLAPLVVQRLFAALRKSATELGTGVIVVEQHVRRALEVADRAYVLKRGEVVLSGSTEHLRTRLGEIEGSYLKVHDDN